MEVIIKGKSNKNCELERLFEIEIEEGLEILQEEINNRTNVFSPPLIIGSEDGKTYMYGCFRFYEWYISFIQYICAQAGLNVNVIEYQSSERKIEKIVISK